ncbi:hypothetical protein P153DRAFT_299422 [Dothidotthia symphoricarpi CBS 119687]|uniref:WW domain-containing protein n=1 Tax=Dothidotthia symphoricarpi CBS 119687 TaxID=1392245 RepID=A0A6A6A3C2_9PLEO|nr:uncharacterized protein P153DRAFT_299422 [Dothidotthia symphoricarpi CBS 119687]KAF2125653.1 hypothetical protein P153DRAFT_299422 [Dothidotthia symphoricarpi CBS 119687]
MPQYQYTPLNVELGEIRLLELHPGAFDDPIKISIFNTPFADPPSQVSLRKSLVDIQQSLPYGWVVRETVEKRIFFFNRLEVYSTWEHPDPNYEKTFYESTDDQFIQKLWIDAVCINQMDLSERSEQVVRMGSIYKYAQRVVAWLGCASHNSPLALRTLDFLGRQIEMTNSGFCFPAPMRVKKDWWNHQFQEPSIIYDTDTWQALYDLLSRSWFTRLWIMQEIHLANHHAIVKCGTEETLWYRLRRAVVKCRELKPSHVSSEHIQHRIRNTSLLCEDIRRKDMIMLLGIAGLMSCSEPRDKVFALLGLLPETLSRRIQPSYIQPVEELYKHMALAIIELTGSLEVLHSQGAFPGSSWIPDWSKPLEGTHVSANRLASGHSVANFDYNTPSTLSVTGVSFDTVVAVSEPLPQNIHEGLTTLCKFWLTSITPSQMYPTGETMAEACARVMTYGILLDQYPEVPCPTLAEAQLPFHELLNGADVSAVEDHVHCHWFLFSGQTLFKTKKGYIGVANGRPQHGDNVAVILGSPIPLLIRKRPSHTYALICDSYIDGIMDGEALLGPLSKDWTFQLLINYAIGRRKDYIETFKNVATQEIVYEDPRLAPIPEEWERTEAAHDVWPTETVEAYRNKITGQVLKDSDPRLLPDALRARGVPLEVFSLV